MPPRRTHKKSRQGCDQCKKRRVKCDEQGPPCSNCTARELDCTYSNALTRASNTPSSRPSPTTELPSQAGPGRAALPLRELELMHKYSTETYRSLSSSELQEHVWQIIMPRRALEHDFLMSGILSVTSLHIAATTTDPVARTSYIDTGLRYQNQAFSPFRRAINNVTRSNWDVIFACSVITIVNGLVSPQLTAPHDEAADAPASRPDMLENILVVFELLQGVNEFVRLNHSWLEKNEVFPSSRGDFWRPAMQTCDYDSTAALDHLMVVFDGEPSACSEEERSVVRDAIVVLKRCFDRYNATEDTASVIAWLAILDKQFVDGLRNRHCFSLTVLLHWAVLLARLDGKVWWAADRGRFLASEILRMLPVDEVRLQSIWVWPKQQLSL